MDQKQKSRTTHRLPRISILVFRASLSSIILLSRMLLAEVPNQHPEIQASIAAGDFETAEQQLRRLEGMAFRPESLRGLRLELLSRKGGAAYEKGDLDLAASAQRTEQELRFEDIRALVAAGRSDLAGQALAMRPLQERISPAGKLLQAEIWQQLGEFSFRYGNLAAARQYYIQAFQYWPNHPLIRERYYQLINYRAPHPAQTIPAPQATAGTSAPVGKPVNTPGGKQIHIHIYEDGQVHSAPGDPGDRTDHSRTSPKDLLNQIQILDARLSSLQWIGGLAILLLAVLTLQTQRLKKGRI